jgi:hypothetical protein
MGAKRQAEFQRGLQDERIAGRKDWVRYVELKSAMYRSHVEHVQDELGPILDDLMRREMRGAGADEPTLSRVVAESEHCG